MRTRGLARMKIFKREMNFPRFPNNRENILSMVMSIMGIVGSYIKGCQGFAFILTFWNR